MMDIVRIWKILQSTQLKAVDLKWRAEDFIYIY
jgi:hypothetical protein